MPSVRMIRKEHIVFTTIDVMNEQGVQAVSTREIAKREGVSESAIFKHFPKKSDLIIAVLNFFSQYDQDIFESSRIKNESSIQAIRYIIETYATYYQNYPAITAISQAFDEMRNNPYLEEKVQSIVNSRLDTLSALIKEAQEAHEIHSDLDSEMLADIIMGTFNSICFKWRMVNYSFSLKDKSLDAIDLILRHFTNAHGGEKNDKSVNS